MHHRALLFMWILGVGEVKGGGLNSGPLACITSTLSTEISAKPKSFLFHDGGMMVTVKMTGMMFILL